MKPRSLTIGDVVQISPEIHMGFFRGCFMTVTEPKEFGAMGFIALAYYRAKWEEMEYVGHAEWGPAPEEGLDYMVAE